LAAEELTVGFIYSFSVTESREVEGFFVITPPEVLITRSHVFIILLYMYIQDKNLHFRIDVLSNPSGEPLTLQLFLGRGELHSCIANTHYALTVSEDLWLLANLTDPVLLNATDSYDVNYEAFDSNTNSSFAQLFSFANPSIRTSPNFTQLLIDNSENEYTSFMWDQDVSLVVYLSNLHSPSQFRLTVDQQDLVFLLYFFATFTM